MSHKFLTLSSDLLDYVERVSLRENSILRSLKNETQEMVQRNMQISPLQGQFMGLIVKLMGAKRVLEVGTFTGYSALSMALALPPDGNLTALDVSEEWTNIGKKYWKKAEVDHKIKLIIGDAKKSLETILKEKGEESFDLAFIDANKEDYDIYYEKALKLLRRGGAIMIDNVLWSGKVLDMTVNDEDTLSLRKLNEKIANDHRVEISMIPIADGLSIIRKI